MFIRSALAVLFHNYYLIIGVILGLFVHVSFIELECVDRLPASRVFTDSNYSTLHAIVHPNAPRTSISGVRSMPTRPRYYSVELGMRDKLFVGVLTSTDRLHTQAVHLNRTLAHLVDGVRYFLTAPRRRRTTSAPLSGVIGFADGGHANMRPFQALGHIADHHLPDFDFFLLANDFNYVNARRLRHLVDGISVAQHVYAGSATCDLDAGILFSNSVLKSMRTHLDWCVMHAVTHDSSENIARCVYKALQLECQGGGVPSYKLHAVDMAKHFDRLRDSATFNRAIVVYPIVGKEDFYLLHAHFAQLELARLRSAIYRDALQMDDVSWPPGERPPSRPATRFDVVRQAYFNRTHIFAPDDFTTARRHSRAEWLDLQNILQSIERHAQINDSSIQLDDVINGYRTFDMSRGVDYVLDVRMTRKRSDSVAMETVDKRFAVCKPVGNVEFVAAPYVTESSKVTVLLPIEESDVAAATLFLRRFDANVLPKKDKVLLMFVFLYQAGTPSKGDAGDIFAPLKEAAVLTSARYRSEDAKVAWVSIRLPTNADAAFVSRRAYSVLSFAVVDLALKKVGVESLLLIGHVYADMLPDFLNRVRMNTILNYQLFAPIPFRFYDAQVALYDNDDDMLEINKNNGHFDHESYDFVSFYGKDYVAARKRCKHYVPLMRVDSDISRVLDEAHRSRGNIVAMFVEYLSHVHTLRAPDMSLRWRYHRDVSTDRRNWFIGTRNQLASALQLQKPVTVT